MSIWNQFWRNRAGNFAMMMCIAAIPIIGAASLAVDYGIARNLRTKLQDASDAAALAVATSDLESEAEQRKLAEQVLQANLAAGGWGKGEVLDIEVNDKNVLLTASATSPVLLGGVLGIEAFPVTALTEITLPDDKLFEVAMVLDTTGSMQGKKLADLKKAANKLLDILEDKEHARFEVGLVPFAEYVNVGLSRRNEPWLKVPDDYTVPRRSCHRKSRLVSETNCRMVTWTTYNDGTPTVHSGRQCDREYEYYGPEICKDWQETHVWHGCVGSRDYPLNVRDESPGVRIPGLLDVRCGEELVPLTDKLDVIRASIGRMKAKYETYIPAGVMWGWRVLSSAQPFNEGQRYGDDVEKIMIVMTDGNITVVPKYPSHQRSQDVEVSEALLKEICTNAKEEGIRIITVKVDENAKANNGKNNKGKGVDDGIVSGVANQDDIFLSCASTPEDAILVNDTAKLEKVFSDIGSRIGNIYVSK